MFSKTRLYFKRMLSIRKLLKYELKQNIERSEKKIVLNSIRFLPDVFIMEVNLGLILIKSGYSVEIILDDGEFKHTDTLLFRSNKPLIYFKFYFYLNRLKRKFEFYFWNLLIGKISKNLTFTKVSKINDKINDSFETSDLKKFVKESMIRFFQTDIIDNDYNKLWYEKLTFKNSIISKKIGIYAQEQLELNTNNRFITSHGIYSIWGPAFDEIKELKKKVVYGPNFYQVNSLSFFNSVHQVTNNEDSLVNFLKFELTNAQKNKVTNYISNRLSFKEKDTKVYFSNDSEKNKFILKDRKELPGKVFVAFPNIVWDGNVYDRNNLYSTISEWLIDLIKHFKKNNRNSLIIRFHPAETTWFKGTKTFESILDEQLKDIDSYKNILIISSSISFNSYTLFNNYVDFTLVYDGIIGLESTFFNVPVIFAANGRFNVKNYGLQFNSSKDYMEYIANPKGYNKIADDKKIAEKLIYYYMFHNSRYFPVLDNENSDFGLDFEVFYRDKKKFDLSINSIMQGLRECI